MRSARAGVGIVLLLASAACTSSSAPAAGSPATTAPGRRLVSAYVSASGYGSVLKVLGRDGRYHVLAAPAEAQHATAAVSPDGRLAAAPDLSSVSARAGRIALIGTATGRRSWIPTPLAPSSVSWAPDSRHVVVLGRPLPSGTQIAVVDTSSGRTRRLELGLGGRRRSALGALFGPGGTGLDVLYGGSGPQGGDLRLSSYTAAGSLLRTIRLAGSIVGSSPWSPSGRRIALLGEPAGSARPPTVVTQDSVTGHVVGRFSLDGAPVSWLDEGHLVVEARTSGRPELDSVDLAGRYRRRLSALPPDTLTPPTLFLAPAGEAAANSPFGY